MEYKLNKEQQEAVLNWKGPVRIIAGPGSGKTRTIIEKIIYLIEEKKVNPNRILIITFSNKASNEIKKRIFDSLGYSLKHVFTYHGLASYFLRTEAEELLIDPNYRIIDSKDQEKIIKENIESLSEDEKDFFYKKDVKNLISKFSSYRINEEKFLFNNSKESAKILELFKKFQSTKKELNLYDFDDLLKEFDNFLLTSNTIREKWKEKFDFLFVDEFQDTNDLQYNIIKKISKKDSNITIVGDPDQNIYAWRGANIDIILNFEKDFENVKTIFLKQNYRSTKNIIDVSNKLISNNKNRVEFKVSTENETGEPVQVIEFENKYKESQFVIKEIVRIKKKYNYDFKDFAIIFRSNFASREYETELLKNGINYIFIGGFKFYERSEIKTAINYLRFLILKDDFSLNQIINFPARGVGEKSFQKINSESKKQNLTIWEYLKKEKELFSKKNKLFNLIEKTIYFSKKIENNQEDFLKIFEEFLKEIELIDYYKENFDDKFANILSFLENMKISFEKKELSNRNIIDFLNEISLLSSSDKSEIKDHVNLITAHSSKGTEYKVVFFVQAVEGIIPNFRSFEDKNKIEEERRTFYVGITRAEELLYVTTSCEIDFNGHKKFPSRFLSELKIKRNFFKKENRNKNYINLEDEDLEVPKNFSSKNLPIMNGDIIFHRKFGEGVVIKEDGEFFSVAFDSKNGIKELMMGHESYFKKIG